MPLRKNNVLPSDLPKKQPVPAPLPPQQQQQPDQMTEEQAVIGADLQKSRDEMYAAIAQFRAQLNDSTLPANRSHSQKEAIDKMWNDLNASNGKLEVINVGEGPLALTFTSMSGLLALKDQINELKFSNALLLRRITALEQAGKKEPSAGAV